MHDGKVRNNITYSYNNDQFIKYLQIISATLSLSISNFTKPTKYQVLVA